MSDNESGRVPHSFACFANEWVSAHSEFDFGVLLYETLYETLEASIIGIWRVADISPARAQLIKCNSLSQV